jgi:hypothetical protein
LRFGALVVGEDGRVRPIRVRCAHDTAKPRTHVSAFVREIVVGAAHVVPSALFIAGQSSADLVEQIFDPQQPFVALKREM